jgi:hypothetical protein
MEGGVVHSLQVPCPAMGTQGVIQKLAMVSLQYHGHLLDFWTTLNTMASIWTTLLRYKPCKTISTCLHGLTEADETVPWKESALQALCDGDLRLAQLCLLAERQEDEIPCTTPSYIHAMAQGPWHVFASGGKHVTRARSWWKRGDVDG